MLEVQVAEVDARTEQRAEGVVQPGWIQATGDEQAGLGESQRGFGHLQDMGTDATKGKRRL